MNLDTLLIVIGGVIGMAIVRAIRERPPRKPTARVTIIEAEIHDAPYPELPAKPPLRVGGGVIPAKPGEYPRFPE